MKKAAVTTRSAKLRSAKPRGVKSGPAKSGPAKSAATPTAKIAVAVATPRWAKLLPSAERLARRAARAALAQTQPPVRPTPRLTLLLADDATLRRLNHDFRGIDKPTNVLSFPAAATPGWPVRAGQGIGLGDIALSAETLAREARQQGKSLADHLTHLTVHGTLHLLGYDHMTDRDAKRMEARERRILKGLGIEDPYRLRTPRRRP